MGGFENQAPPAEAAEEAKPVSLEAAMEQIEGLIKQMESGSLALEEMIARYETGVKLVKFCEERLAAAEQRIRTIARDAAGKLAVEDLPGDNQ